MVNVKAFLRLAVVSCVFGMAAAASGQNFQFFGGDGGPGGGPGGQEPPVNSKQVARYADLLGMDADQKEAATALLEGMQTEWEAGALKFRDEMASLREEFQESRDTSIWTDRLPAILKTQRETRSKLEQSFMSDFKSLLSEPQAARWGDVERVYRRDTTIPRGRLSGESVDLVKLADELPLSESAKSAVSGTLAQYEADLDRALVERNEIVDEAQKLVGDGPAGIERAMQDEQFMKLREKAHEARLKVRDTNQRYARQLAAALPADEAAKFNQEFTRRSFPDVYRKSLAAESLSAAEGFDDLTPEQKQQIAAMRESYAAEVERANRALMEATEKYEATSEGYASALGGGMTFRMRGPGGEDETKSNPVDEARNAKREVEKKALENLKGILTDGQRERLPKRRERGAGGPRAMLGGGANGAVFVTDPNGGNDETIEEGNVVHVVRQVEMGPDGKPKEATAVFVQKIGPGEEGEGGEGDEMEIEIHQKTEHGDEPEGEPEPEPE